MHIKGTSNQQQMADIQTYPTVKRQISLPNDIETIPQLNEFIDTVAEEIGLDMPLTMSLNLALEEAVVNVMEFDPTKQAEADTTLSVEERAIGGLGIHLVRQIMDVISYERIDGFNVLTLKKKLLTT